MRKVCLSDPKKRYKKDGSTRYGTPFHLLHKRDEDELYDDHQAEEDLGLDAEPVRLPRSGEQKNKDHGLHTDPDQIPHGNPGLAGIKPERQDETEDTEKDAQKERVKMERVHDKVESIDGPEPCGNGDDQ